MYLSYCRSLKVDSEQFKGGVPLEPVQKMLVDNSDLSVCFSCVCLHVVFSFSDCFPVLMAILLQSGRSKPITNVGAK